MSVETLAAALEREHREIDEGIETFAAGLTAGQDDARALARAMAALRRHIYLEEEFLFPPLRAAGLIAPVFVMVREHGQLWTTLDALQAEVGDGDIHGDVRGVLPESVTDLLRDLQQLLEAHNPKEEQILYPQADQVLTASVTAELRALLDAGRVPDGWVCQAHRP